MKKVIFLVIFAVIIGGMGYAFEVQIPVNFVYGYNFLAGTLSGTYNNSKILEIEHDYDLLKLGGGLGADFYIWQNDTFGFYFRFDYYNPYHLKVSNTKVKTPFGGFSSNDFDRDLENSSSFDLFFGVTKKFKIQNFEFPIALALVFPQVTTLEFDSDLGNEGIVEFGLVTDACVRYNITKYLFVNIGGRAGFGFAFGGFPDSKIEGSISEIFNSFHLSAYAGLGITLGRK